ncbi:MAG: arsenic resistance N-acetyltransferase ArsN2 [Cytophagales bacterium]|nr:arsenic resistance N-acetyltransferase ArsN2 [Cytophagales bacterium]
MTHLLEKAKLPTADLPADLSHFFKAETENTLAGTVGLELYGQYALLRSLAVDDAYRNLKIGQALYAKAMQHATDEGVSEVFLITNTAEAYFAKQGFVKIDRNTVPTEIQQTQQFQGVCPSSATVMRLAPRPPKEES